MAALLCVLPACGGSASPSDTRGSSAAPSSTSSGAPTGTSSGASPGGSGSESPSSPAAGGSSASSDADVRTLRITVTGKRVSPAPARVDLASGERLRLVITVDHDDEVHAHGFEVEREVTAGQPVTIDLTGEQPGLYEVETHNPSLRLLQVLVR